MYRSLVLLAFAACSLSACSNESKKVPPGQTSASIINNPRTANGLDKEEVASLPVLTFPDTTHDFGVIREGEVVEHVFEFKNTGRSPLVIAGAEASCGCTTPTFTHEAVPPGGSGSITVKFASAGKRGRIGKTVSVTSNAYPAVKVITITADIQSAEK